MIGKVVAPSLQPSTGNERMMVIISLKVAVTKMLADETSDQLKR
jgi:hypothetical protein